jgi:hypothetical protein
MERRGMPERWARFANGLLVFACSLLTLAPQSRLSQTGSWLTLFMGTALVFSGITGFCGWLSIFNFAHARFFANRSSVDDTN